MYEGIASGHVTWSGANAEVVKGIYASHIPFRIYHAGPKCGLECGRNGWPPNTRAERST